METMDKWMTKWMDRWTDNAIHVPLNYVGEKKAQESQLILT